MIKEGPPKIEQLGIEQLRDLVRQLQEENAALKKENERLRSEGKKPEVKEAIKTEIDKVMAKIIELANNDYNFANSSWPGAGREDWKEKSLQGVYGKKVFKAGCVNALERRRSWPVAPPAELKSDNAGDLFIVEERGKFIGLPRPGLVYQESYHNTGAFSEVFEISPQGDKYNPAKMYKITKLIKPAIFNKDELGKLTLVERGEIVLEEKR